ncbi:FadR/GntR family transcriptional regulator [Methylocystis parvus]|uniref:FadR family transcriptional regulator n=1 Tax=Methylocystis parvus TaxID=134 RepID=A0A6B8MEE1_9HYPH|nr:FadR/GntR family transcriptional regulator [Methylocystis parvus]QGN00103.1 FadR family transcriptional regulator [Methylocystis parvus]WBK02397.1 FadR family transcriptional regulator [Methylocystis parvus OBBP]
MKPTRPTTLSQVPRRSLVDSTIDLIRAQIEGGVWQVGEKIPKEDVLAERLRVGRNTVREAIRALSYTQLLEVRQGDGTYVRSNIEPAEIMRHIRGASLREHFELRAMFETNSARLAAHHRSEEDIALLRLLLKQRGEEQDHTDRATFVDADIEFHGAIARMSSNAVLAELYRYFSPTMRAYMLFALSQRDLPMPSLDLHEAIVDAIARGDAEAAETARRALSTPLIIALESKDRSMKYLSMDWKPSVSRRTKL